MTIKNLLGLIVKLSVTPLIISLSTEFIPHAEISSSSSLFALAFSILGLLGMLATDTITLRFGDGVLHYPGKVTRLVDVGFYARTRHPFFWFFSLYQLGILTYTYAFSIFALSIWGIITLSGFLYLLFSQEKQLSHSLGEQYVKYKADTPFWFWKIKIQNNRSIKLLSQVVWVFGMLIIRNWYKIKVSGTEHIPHQKPFILVANHETYIDPFLFGIFVPFEMQFVTTADVFTTPLMRFLLKGIGTFPMRRHRQDLKSIRTMIRMIKSGQVVGIFPEGGRSTDGSPLPILKETLKLIQHSKVPILPVHLDGAYEIWPRWASNRRRGQVSATFKPIIPVEDQTDLKQLESLIQNSIFAQSKVYRSVKSRAHANGLEKFLWACNECQSRNTIELLSNNKIGCRQCNATWDVTANYTLINQHTDKTNTLHSWIRDINETILNSPLNLESGFQIESGEQVFLTSPIGKYKNDEELELVDKLELTLTNQRFILARQNEILHSWALNTVTIFTLDYFNAISIGVGGIRHSFSLPANDISLKWQTYFETLTAS